MLLRCVKMHLIANYNIEMSLFLIYLQCTDYFVLTPYCSPYYVACIYVYIGQKHLYAGLPNK